ncbi:hypothetical protein ACFQ14_01590 [Pseudahrensia aquimaris]|uniref:Uncharacterized protein n=1 Tax=Pseudahrensia aquimaris TaxID=744461 RepID=A0ABW3FCU0_9HYPH
MDQEQNLEQTVLGDKLVALINSDDETLAQAVLNFGAHDVLQLNPRKNDWQRNEWLSGPYTHWRDIAASNCSTVILSGISRLALLKKRYFFAARIRHLLMPMSVSTEIIVWLGRRYFKSGLLSRIGTVEIEHGGKLRAFIVLAVAPKLTDNRHAFYPRELKPMEALNKLKELKYVLLRSIERVENQTPFKDLDLLVDDQDIESLHETFSKTVSTVAMDVYSVSGVGGHDYKTVPYFVPRFAQDILTTSQQRESGIKAANARMRYLSLGYHVLFHAKSAHLDPQHESLDQHTFKSATTYQDLCDAASEALMARPQTISDIEAALKAEGYFPGHDLMAFYARRNPFVKGRYVQADGLKAGLATFLVRDFAMYPQAVENVRVLLDKRFEILKEVDLTAEMQKLAVSEIRGGNWHDKEQNTLALPTHIFVTWDHSVEIPTKRTGRKFPNLDNDRVRAAKQEIRALMPGPGGQPMRVVHSSDNSTEAMEHLEKLDLLGGSALAERLKELGVFKT